MKRRYALKAAGAAIAASGLLSFSAFAADTIKVGMLHSLSGTMAISETVLKDTALMAIDEINAKGGVLGKKLEPVVVDPASNWPLFAEKAKQLISQDKVAVMFGCWTSVSRKSVLPVVEELNGLLFYPVQYEGEELSKNVFYTGAAPNQQAIPAVEYLMSKDGGGAKRFVLLGTDYVYPRTTNKILRAFLKSKGVEGHGHRREVHAVRPQRLPDHRRRHQEVLGRRQDRGDLDDQRRLQRAVLQGARQPGPEGDRRAGRRVLGRRGRAARRRHQAAGRPPGRLELLHESIKNPANDEFMKKWADYAKAKKLAGHKDKPLTNDPMEATYIGIHMWKQAVEKAKSTDTDKVIAAMAGQTFTAPGGITSTMDAKNHHLHKPVFIGEVKADGQFNVVWKTPGSGQGQAVEPVHRRQRQEEGRAREEVSPSRHSPLPAHRVRRLPNDRSAGDPARRPRDAGFALPLPVNLSRPLRFCLSWIALALAPGSPPR